MCCTYIYNYICLSVCVYQQCASEGAHVLTVSPFPTFFKISVTLCFVAFARLLLPYETRRPTSQLANHAKM